ncbi:MAG: AAA family ATPase [Bacteroidota bacterium]|nr:AAA family ATPase [Bacteroidota bacterium]
MDYSAAGNVEFKKFTLIYSENGRGKTTLCAVLRSLRTGENKYIVCRTTLAGNGNPEVAVRLESTNATFKNSKWDNVFPNIEIFDPIFISNNVYSGDYVESDNKRGLYRFVVGEEGMKLATKIDDLDHQIREKNKEIGEKEKEIKKYMVQEISVKDFLSLPIISNIEDQITTKENEIKSLKKSSEIAAKSLLSKIILPTIQLDNIRNTLQRTVESVSIEAMEMVKAHIASCMDENGESWLRDGIPYIKNESCPFCNQSLKSIALVEAYRGYFGDAYRLLKSEIDSDIDSVRASFSKNQILTIQQSIQGNMALAEFWSQYVPGSYPKIEFSDVQRVLDDVSESLLAHLGRKATSPMEEINLDPDLQKKIDAYRNLVEKVGTYNRAVDDMNVLINEKKKATAKGNLALAESELAKLNNTRARHQTNLVKVCNEYERTVNLKKRLEDEKTMTRKTLDAYDKKIFDQYEKDINQYLDKFGAEFKIVETKTSYMGGKPSSIYRISINNTSVELGDSKTEENLPSFKNTLSSGDKSTLAFAFFLAKLDQDTELSNKVVIFDDPISSLDGYRKSCTQQQIIRAGQKAKQVIVLSHDPHFLFGIHNKVSTDLMTIQIKRSGRDSIMTEWDPEEETRSDYVKNYFLLAEYLENGPTGDLREVARSIRPLLEGNLRQRFPREFKSSVMFGQMLDKIRHASSRENLYSLQLMLSEIEEINDYAKKYHHTENTRADTEPINDAELQSYVKRALKIFHGV